MQGAGEMCEYDLHQLKVAKDFAYERMKELGRALNCAWNLRQTAGEEMKRTYDVKDIAYSEQDRTWHEYQAIRNANGFAILAIDQQVAGIQNAAEIRRRMKKRNRLGEEIRRAKDVHLAAKQVFCEALQAHRDAKDLFEAAKAEHERLRSEYEQARLRFEIALAEWELRLDSEQAEVQARLVPSHA